MEYCSVKKTKEILAFHTEKKMALKGHPKWNKSRKTNTVWSHIYVESRRREDLTEKETRFVITTGRVERVEKLDKGSHKVGKETG